MFFSLILLCSLLSMVSILAKDTNNIEFVILITSYNNEKWVAENLRSACYQHSTNPYKVICINDHSTDTTGHVMDDYVKEHNLENLVTVIHNKENVGGMANIYNGVHNYIDDNKVVVSLDGDDLLADDTVLLTLEEYYKNPDVWMTYGSAEEYPSGTRLDCSRKIPKRVFREKKLRESPFTSQHLRTFKAALFKKIAKEDFMYKGSFMKVAWDMAMMFPMLEMCSPRDNSSVNHSRYVSEIVYIYRDDNPISDFRINRKPQRTVAQHIRKNKPYEALDSLK